MNDGIRSSAIERRAVLKGSAVIAVAALGAQAAHSEEPSQSPRQPAAGPTSPSVVVERREHVLVIGLNRPKMDNRLDPPTYALLAQAYHQLEQDPALRVGVLFGYGASFCKGIDVPAFQAVIAGKDEPASADDQIDPFGKTKPRLTKPVVSVVHGDTWNIGHELMLATDIRIAAAGTRFAQMESTQARMPGSGATVRFVRDAGWGQAMRYMLTGDSWDAAEAYRMGLVQEVAPSLDAAFSRGLEIASKIAACAPRSIETTLASAHLAIDTAEDKALSALNAQRTALYRTDDFREGLAASAQHRTPLYLGR
jgi:enoyl-CoA hydratase